MKTIRAGFALVEVALIFVVITMLIGLGWYVWSANNNANSNLSNADSANSGELPKVAPVTNFAECIKASGAKVDSQAFPQTCTSKAGEKFTDPEPAKGWKEYSSTAGKYTLSYPSNWDLKNCIPEATDLVVYLGPTKASSALCNSEHPGQIWIVSTPAEPTASEQQLSPETYKDISTKSVTVDGLKGERQVGRLKVGDDGPWPVPANTKIVRYFFVTKGRSYIFAYVQTPSGDFKDDFLAEYDYLVTKTVKFNN